MTQLELIQYRIQNLWNHSVESTWLVVQSMTTEDTFVSSGFLPPTIDQIEPTGWTESWKSDWWSRPIPAVFDQFDNVQVQSTPSSPVSNSLDNQIDKNQSSDQNSYTDTIIVDPEFEQVQTLINDLL